MTSQALAEKENYKQGGTQRSVYSTDDVVQWSYTRK